MSPCAWRSKEFSKFVNGNVCITENGTQGAKRHDSPFVNWHSHTPAIGFTPQVQVAATLPVFFKAHTFQHSNQLLAVDAWQFLTHAATGTDNRVMTSGSCSTGIGSPSTCIASM